MSDRSAPNEGGEQGEDEGVDEKRSSLQLRPTLDRSAEESIVRRTEDGQGKCLFLFVLSSGHVLGPLWRATPPGEAGWAAFVLLPVSPPLGQVAAVPTRPA